MLPAREACEFCKRPVATVDDWRETDKTETFPAALCFTPGSEPCIKVAEAVEAPQERMREAVCVALEELGVDPNDWEVSTAGVTSAAINLRRIACGEVALEAPEARVCIAADLLSGAVLGLRLRCEEAESRARAEFQRAEAAEAKVREFEWHDCHLTARS